MKDNQRVTVTKRMLQEGLLRLLRTKKLSEIKIIELCEESGINRATFYRHYETPRDVLAELEQEITSQAFPLRSRPKSVAEAQEMLEKACTYIYDHADVMKILFRCKAESDFAAKINEFYSQILALRTQEPQFASIDDDTLRIILSLMGGGCYWLLRQWIVEDIPKTPAQIAKIVCSTFRWPDPGVLAED